MPPLGSLVFVDVNVVMGSLNINEISLLAVSLEHYFRLENSTDPLVLYFPNEAEFNMDSFNKINSYIRRQTQPVCLIAYNGSRFDFPILKRQFQALNVRLSDDVMYADSLDAFYDAYNLESHGVPFGNAQRRFFCEGNPKPNFSFRLKDIHELIARDRVSNAHSSKECTRMAAETSIHLHYLCIRFLDWVEQNQRYFATIEPMNS